MRWIARRKAAWVTSAWLAAIGLAQGSAPPALPPTPAKSPAGAELAAPTLIPLYSRPVSPYGPALPGLHPAVTVTPILMGQAGPAPHEAGPANLPSPAPPGGLVDSALPAPMLWADTPAIQPFPRLDH